MSQEIPVIRTYEVLVSEQYAGYITVEATDEQKAYDDVRFRLQNGWLDPTKQFDSDTYIEVQGEAE
jgi:hypothetical protein